MQRDIDLMRLLLLELEGEQSIDLGTYAPEQLNFHKALIVDAGFAEGIINYSTSKNASADIPDVAILRRLTYAGHEFLDSAKNEKVWNKAKEIVRRNGLALTLEAMKISLAEVI
jgi:uncharacterized protein DUF2513